MTIHCLILIRWDHIEEMWYPVRGICGENHIDRNYALQFYRDAHAQFKDDYSSLRLSVVFRQDGRYINTDAANDAKFATTHGIVQYALDLAAAYTHGLNN